VADRHGAAVAVPANDERALGEAITRLLGDPSALESLSAAAERAARTEYSWDDIARRHLELYDALLAV
jgi:glycosyltransferase involved in cell wall biosynthesis